MFFERKEMHYTIQNLTKLLNSDSWKSNNFRESAIKKEAKNWYQKGLRVITLQGEIEKSPILLLQYLKN